MKLIITLSSLILSFGTNASILDLSPYVGEYKLSKVGRGECAPGLKVQEEDFIYQRAVHSLGLYGVNENNETNVIYQLTGLNAGVDYHLTTNAIFGHINGSWYELETLENNKISAVRIIKNLNGEILWQNRLKADFKEDSVSFTKISHITKNGKNVSSVDSCEYLRL